ncbi:PREDICTED: uncharacterized protein LOC109354031 [Lupinus angustifolius]|uniref:uncharacterized protein LOC109354031 n=1 Tax=Lupinus angustifolius TaxID=3871 RepID=UPI00092E3C16|nr:PREDICTED: uncharacterized protein LOC109354031 [Lupinus angustifolius]
MSKRIRSPRLELRLNLSPPRTPTSSTISANLSFDFSISSSSPSPSSVSTHSSEGSSCLSSEAEETRAMLLYILVTITPTLPLSLISFGLCYALINVGVDVQSLLQKVGISTNQTSEKVSTFALAYPAHKAASPIRLPPTVALTPIVAGWIGKKAEKD